MLTRYMTHTRRFADPAPKRRRIQGWNEWSDGKPTVGSGSPSANSVLRRARGSGPAAPRAPGRKVMQNRATAYRRGPGRQGPAGVGRPGFRPAGPAGAPGCVFREGAVECKIFPSPSRSISVLGVPRSGSRARSPGIGHIAPPRRGDRGLDDEKTTQVRRRRLRFRRPPGGSPAWARSSWPPRSASASVSWPRRTPASRPAGGFGSGWRHWATISARAWRRCRA